MVYYGHAKTAILRPTVSAGENTASVRPAAVNTPSAADEELVGRIMKLIDKGCTLEKIRRKTGADAVFIEDVARMYLTHPGVGVQGILDRIEIKGR